MLKKGFSITEPRDSGAKVKKRTKFSSPAFSIIEALAALFIVGVILALYQVSFSTVLLSRSAKDQEIALRVANNKMEELRAGGYAALPTSSSFSDSQLSSLASSSANMVITDLNTKTKQIIITVRWQEPGSSSPLTISLTTLITKVGGL